MDTREHFGTLESNADESQVASRNDEYSRATNSLKVLAGCINDNIGLL